MSELVEQEQDLVEESGDVEEEVEEGVHHEQEGEEVQYKEDEMLQQFQTEDGSTIVLSSEQIAQMQEGMAEQHYVEEIIGGEEDVHHHHHHEEEGHHQIHDPNVVGEEGMETHQQIHLDADGNAQIVTSDGQMHDLITLHAVGVDAQGNLIPGGNEGDVVEEGMGEHVEIPMDHSGMEQMMGEDGVVEEVISSGTHEEEAYLGDNLEDTNDISQQFLNVQEAIFNPQTGTLQPINSVQNTTPSVRPVKRPAPKPQQNQQQQQQVKYVISQPSADGSQSQQQIFLDANSLQGLIQSGTITLDGSGNKQNLIIAPSPSKKQVVTRSPAKILPAPVPVGDQLQNQQQGMKKILVMQGNSLQSLSGLSQPGETKLIQTTSPGGTSHVQYVRVVRNSGAQHKIPIAPATLKPKPVAPKPGPGQTIITLPHGSSDLSSLQNSTPGLGNLLVLPNYVTVKNDQNQTVQIRTSDSLTSSSSVLTDSNSLLGGLSQGLSGGGSLDSFRSLLEPNGMRPRKPCNCTKSQCLKLYCDCFANGEFCHLCNCTNCFNNLNHEEDRQKAIKLVLERNPGAFRPKIGKSSQTGEAHERRHNKGCNCRRSGCLKNYCECYEAKIFCSGICKCTGCKNCIENIPSGLPNGVGVEQHFAGAGTAHRQTLKDLAEAAEVRVQQQNQVKNKMRAQMQEVSPQNNLGIMVPPIVFRYPSGSISYEVVTSTVELLLAKAEAGEKQKLSEGEIEHQILEEFSECLASVMDLGTSVDMVLKNDVDDSRLSRLCKNDSL